MPLDPDVCYRALQARDRRFDGRFFTAVRSTGVYCRPVCPARTPRRANCLFLPCAAAAEAAGFRACRRCRPETAPGTPAWSGTSATVSRALRLIGEGALDGGRVGDLAARVGIGERHLRRLFLEHLGATPLAVAQTRRVHFAARLLTETSLPIAQVAFAAGFTSVRRFNDAIRQRFARSPRELRERRRGADPGEGVSIRVPYRPPFAWAALVRYLAPRATAGVEQVEGACVRRALRVAGGPALVEVAPLADADALGVRVRGGDATRLLEVAERARTVFDASADPREIELQLGRDAALRERLRALPGVRVPGAWDPFEIAVRCILGQQVTVPGATRLAGRLAARYGEPLPPELVGDAAGPSRLFPEPAALVDAPLESLGLPRARAGAVRALARAVAEGALDLAGGADPDATRATLLALPGVGPWTSELVLLRACREPDAFPSGDLGLRRALDRGARELEQRAERWRPWRAYAAMLLWSAGGAAHPPPGSRPGSRPASGPEPAPASDPEEVADPHLHSAARRAAFAASASATRSSTRSMRTSSSSKTSAAPPGTCGGLPRSP